MNIYKDILNVDVRYRIRNDENLYTKGKVIMSEEKECAICKTMAINELNIENALNYYSCPICGKYELLILEEQMNFNKNHLASYLLYHRFIGDRFERRYNTVMSKEKCDEYKKEIAQNKLHNRHPVHMSEEMVETWYPRTFSDRIDNILIYLNGRIQHVGQYVSMYLQELISMLFVDRFEIDVLKYFNKYGNCVERKIDDCICEVNYMLKYLSEIGYIEYNGETTIEGKVDITLTPLGYKRVDELQKNSAYGRNVLVAMKFGDDTLKLREAIRKGITDAEYIAVFIDEVQHNDFITPELLKYIRDSKFVVVDLTHKNNGAYFEEGYAMGIGKAVIQLCQKDTKLHFDIAQKNTIIWDTEEDIPERLTNRIKATID